MVPESQIQMVELYRLCDGLTIEDLWLRCFELGGMTTQLQLNAFLHGANRPTPREHNLMAIAFNEYFMEFDPCRSVPYVEYVSANN